MFADIKVMTDEKANSSDKETSKLSQPTCMVN